MSEKPKIRILVVVDGHLNFSEFRAPDEIYSASVRTALCQITQSSKLYDFRFLCERAYLCPGERRDFEFKEGVLVVDGVRNFEQLWLLGSMSQSKWKIDPSEVKEIERFMNKGGGVFATGDHEDLGSSMCANIPRVKAMRGWLGGEEATAYKAQPEEGTGSHTARRLDTRGWSRPFESGCETQALEIDGIGKEIEPRLEWGLDGWQPHPIMRLCLSPLSAGAREAAIDATYCPIKYLPDHAHEGVCFDYRGVPSDSVTFVGSTSHSRVICDGHTRSGRVNGQSRVTSVRQFGVVSVFEPAPEESIGPIVVDSTFHHWTIGNTTGFFLAARGDQGKMAWAHITRYYVNVAEWLVNMNTKSKLIEDRIREIVASDEYRDEFQSNPCDDSNSMELAARFILFELERDPNIRDLVPYVETWMRKNSQPEARKKFRVAMALLREANVIGPHHAAAFRRTILEQAIARIAFPIAADDPTAPHALAENADDEHQGPLIDPIDEAVNRIESKIEKFKSNLSNALKE